MGEKRLWTWEFSSTGGAASWGQRCTQVLCCQWLQSCASSHLYWYLGLVQSKVIWKVCSLAVWNILLERILSFLFWDFRAESGFRHSLNSTKVGLFYWWQNLEWSFWGSRLLAPDSKLPDGRALVLLHGVLSAKITSIHSTCWKKSELTKSSVFWTRSPGGSHKLSNPWSYTFLNRNQRPLLLDSSLSWFIQLWKEVLMYVC